MTDWMSKTQMTPRILSCMTRWMMDQSVHFSPSVVSDYLQPHGLPPCPSPTPRACLNSCPSSRWCHPTILSSVVPFSSCLLSQHQALFQWVSSSHQVAKVLELQHQSFQWIFRADFLEDWLVWSPCSPRDSQESSPSAAAAAKSLQSCLTLCNPIDGSPPGSPIPGILQARILEWVAISFSNAWKWKVKVKSLSHVQLLATPWTATCQALPSMGFPRQEYSNTTVQKHQFFGAQLSLWSNSHIHTWLLEKP